MPLSLEQMTSSKVVSVGGTDFIIHRMKPLAVIAVARRLAPLLGILKNMRDEAEAPKEAALPSEDAKVTAPTSDQSFANAMDRFGPLLDGLARLPEDDVNFVIGACLGCVQMRGSGPPRVWSAEHGRLTDDSLSPGDVMSLTGQVLFKVFEELVGDLPDLGLMGAKAA